MAVTRDQVIWVYRILLQRDPESEDVIEEKISAHEDRIDMMLSVMKSEEFDSKYPPRPEPA